MNCPICTQYTPETGCEHLSPEANAPVKHKRTGPNFAKKLSNVDLSELRIMAGAMLDQMETFKHVSHHTPDAVRKTLEKFYKDLNIESDRREDEF